MISTEVMRVSMKGNGVTKTFQFPFRLNKASDLLVQSYDGTTLSEVTNYAIEPADGKYPTTGGTVTYPNTEADPAIGSDITIIISRNIAIIQDDGYSRNDTLSVTNLEKTYDSNVQRIQQVKDLADRSVKIPITSNADVTLPTPEAGKAFYWDETGTKLVNGMNPQEATDRAETAAARAESAEAEAESHVETVIDAQNKAKEYAEKAQTAQGNAEIAESEAKQAAKDAATSAASIEGDVEASAENAAKAEAQAQIAMEKANAAASSATSANTSAQEASLKATAAEQARSGAEASAKSASESATTAKVSATDAYASSVSAGKNADRAQTYLDTVEADAEKAQTAANGAKASEERAILAETNAGKSESNAKTSETNAATSESNASASAELAKERADSIKGDVEKAAASANAAATSETNAAASLASAQEIEKEVEAALVKVVGAAKYAGSVANYSDLPTNPQAGDIWNVQNEDTEHRINAGDNVIWDGTAWDNLSGFVDLSDYPTNSDVAKAIVSTTYSNDTITFTHKDASTSTATINNVAHATSSDTATKATQDADGNVISNTYAKSENLATVATSGAYSDLSGVPTNHATYDTATVGSVENPVYLLNGVITACDVMTAEELRAILDE